MFEPNEYELLDFGAGRRLERLGGIIVDRPAPAVSHLARQRPASWRQAQLSYDVDTHWIGNEPAGWRVQWRGMTLHLKPTATGQVGVFPEQALTWRWIAKWLEAGPQPQVLNLFAYTGGSTLAAAMAGASVVHVDAAKPVVQWARENARASGLQEAPVRWITDDVRKFCLRELKRRRRYALVILDPPSYGHGSKGQPWKFERDLPELFETIAGLLVEGRAACILTWHSTGVGQRDMRQLMQARLPHGNLAGDLLELADLQGRPFGLGERVIWSRE